MSFGNKGPRPFDVIFEFVIAGPAVRVPQCFKKNPPKYTLPVKGSAALWGFARNANFL
jgi:hypothetical protein